MSRIAVADNIYSEGAVVFAKADPTRKLIVMRYYQRVYYCAVADNPDHKHFAYFQRELTPAVAAQA